MRGANLIVFAILCGSAAVLSQDNVQTRIPDYLLDCYRNVTLNHREFRPPMTLATFIELVRKVETYPGHNMDIRVLTTTLLHRFRLDGIEQDSEVMNSPGVIPFSVKGSQFFKHRVLLRSFIPGDSDRFRNESLTAMEQCALHFLLSNSVDRGQRGDEGSVCNQVNSGYRRRARDAPDSEVEVFTVDNLVQPADEKGKMFLDDKDSVGRPPQVARSRATPRRVVESPGVGVASPRVGGASPGVGVASPRASGSTQPYSECPVENGVALTPYGSVTLGTLLAGIAAALQPMSVDSRQLNVKIVDSVEVQNLWAATLAGDLAELVLLQGPKYGTNMRLGPAGGWNSTLMPRWYFIKEAIDNQMTDSEIRGGLDGLIIGTRIQDWTSRTGNTLKLSQLLDMYYSERGVLGDQQSRACMRRDNYNQVADKNTVQTQTYGFATILDPQMITKAILDEDTIETFSTEAANRISNYVPSNLASEPCAVQRQDAPTSLVAVELYVVVDTTWTYRDIQPMLMSMMTRLEMGQFGSNLTLISAKEVKTILNGTKSFVEFTTNLTEPVYSQNMYGTDLPGVLRILRNLFRFQQDEEKRLNIAGSGSKVVVVIPGPGQSLSDSDMTIARDHFQYLHEYVPDVKFLYLSQGKDRYAQLVEDSTKDLFDLRLGGDEASISLTLDPVIERIKQVHLRLLNPSCGSSWSGGSTSASYTGYATPGVVAYYRLHQNYIYSAGWGKIKVQGSGLGPLKVCQSRRTQYPGNSTSGGDTACKEINSDAWEFTFDKPCDNYDFVGQCPPFFVSVEATVRTGVFSSPPCNEANCRYPDSVRFVVSTEGLTCTAGIGRILGSSALVAILSVLVAALRNC